MKDKKKRHCEICKVEVGEMSDKAWEQMKGICDICFELHKEEIVQEDY